jgi:hypothetical protein
MRRKAGNRLELDLPRSLDPMFAVLRDYNDRIATGAGTATPEEPTTDGKSYPVEGAPQPLCRPYVKIGYRTGFDEGPEVRFVRLDDGLHLTATLMEDVSRRVPGAAPFDVRCVAVRLIYGSDSSDILTFPTPSQVPGSDPNKGPAFRIELDVLAPADERQARIVKAMQDRKGASWQVDLEIKWLEPPPPQPSGDPPPRPPRAAVWRSSRESFLEARPWLGDRVRLKRVGPVAESPVIVLPSEARIAFPPDPPPAPQPGSAPAPAAPTEKLIQFTRVFDAEYPLDARVNQGVYAAVTGDYAALGWRASASGWFAPTPLPNTVYCLPDAYRLAVEIQSGLPSIQAVLFLKQGAAPGAELDPSQYLTQMTLKALPEFDPTRLEALRDFVRNESSGELKHADLVLGGYKNARFKADESLAALGELFGGFSAPDHDGINPEVGFTLNYRGNAEFISLLVEKLKKPDGIGGAVLLELVQPDGVTTQSVPVILSLVGLASMDLDFSLVEPQALLPSLYTVLPGDGPARIADHYGVRASHPHWWRELWTANPEKPRNADGNNWATLYPNEQVHIPASWLPPPPPPPPPSPDDGPPTTTSQDVRFKNPSALPITIAGVSGSALRKLPISGRILEAVDVATSAAFPLRIPPRGTRDVSLTLPAPMIVNGWDLSAVSARPVLPLDVMMSLLFDAASSGVRGFRVTVESTQLRFFDRLSDADKEKLADVVGLEVQVRRVGSARIESVRLSREAPSKDVLLSRTIADFLADRSGLSSQFQYRKRLVHIDHADDWSEWSDESGSDLVVYF